MKRLILSFMAMLFCAIAIAQDIEVRSFELRSTDLEAKINPVLDANGVAAALIRVVSNVTSLSFEGNIVKEPVYDNGEWRVYVPAGSKYLKIKADGYFPISYDFPIAIESYHSYELQLRKGKEEQARSLILATAGLSKSQNSYGVMLGYVKKFGAYVRVRSDFNKVPETSKMCSSTGIVDGYQGWFTGNSQMSRTSVTGGGLIKIMNPLYLYAGAGYGVRNLVWEMYDGTYAKVRGSSYQGLETELGLILRAGPVALSAGISANSFKVPEASLGFGFMF